MLSLDTKTLCWPILCAIVTSSALAHAKPSKADKREASRRFEKAVELYEEGDLRAALIEFKRAYSLAPTYHLLYNMAQTAAELKDYADAHRYYRDYLSEGGDAIRDERREEVEGAIAQLEGYLAKLEIRVNVEGAEVSIDDLAVGVSPLEESLVVSAGRRKVSVQCEGYLPFETRLDLAGNDIETLKVTLRPLASEVETPPVVVAPATPTERGQSTAFWITTVTTSALAIGTGISAYRTLQARDAFNLELARVPGDNDNIEAARSDLKRASLVTDIGLGLTAAGIVTSLLLLRSEDEKRSDALRVSVGSEGVVIFGRF